MIRQPPWYGVVLFNIDIDECSSAPYFFHNPYCIASPNKQNYNNTDPLYYNLVDEDDESYEYAAETDPDAVSYEEEDFADDPGDRTLIAKGIQITLFIDRYEWQKIKAILILPSSMENRDMYP